MSDVLKISKLDHVMLRVKDLDHSIRWYQEVMGGEVSRRLKPPVNFAQVRLGAAMLDLCAADGIVGLERGGPPVEDGPNMHHLCIKVDSFNEEALIEHFTSHGVTPFDICKRFGADGYGPCMYVADPDGNWIEIKGPSEPPPPDVE